MSIPSTIPIVLGSRFGTKQGQVGIPGGPTGDDPGLLYLESSDSSATKSGLYIWADSTNVLRYHTSKPTNEDGDGSIIATTAASNANRYLSNLLSTTINTSLISDTDSTDSLGSSSIYWANGYIDKIYLNSTATMSGASAGINTVVGDMAFSDGMINVDTTTDETSYITRNLTGATSAVFEVEATHTGDAGVGILIDVNGTGNSTALQISHDGDYPVIDIDAGAARTGNVIDIAMANQLAQTAIDITGAATGTSGEGIVHIDITGVMAGDGFRVDSTGANAATAALFKGVSTGKQAAATSGIVANFTDSGAATATSYTMYIASTNNEALHVDTGEVLVDEFVTATTGLVTAFDGAQDLTATPTNAEFDTSFGATALGKAGFIGVAEDTSDGKNYLVVSDGTDWHYVALTVAA
jgi:hypothetical protein